MQTGDGNCPSANIYQYGFGFLKTVVLIDPSVCGITNESRNGIDPPGLESLRCELDSGVNVIDVMEEFIFTCRTQDDTSVIHIPLPHFGRVLGSLDGFYLKVLHEEVGHYGADGWPHGCSIDLLIKAALELEIGCLQAKLQ